MIVMSWAKTHFTHPLVLKSCLNRSGTLMHVRARNNWADLSYEDRKVDSERVAGIYTRLYWNNPAFRERRKQQATAWNAARKHSEEYKRYHALRRWCLNYPWVRDELPWKSHRPILYQERTQHTCFSCQWDRRSGMKLWWKAIGGKGDAGFLCQTCYARQDWNTAMPTGFEDLRRLNEIAARKKQLDEAARSVSSPPKA
ncbi:hypothetical protein AUEXF2481DRAFT_636468 [Aureobasidium subglaciale EXF-2481]|uniref:Uncharacterized protein n=1 Tax=Aureobasidium subglaciale (strain EXF-2481) TaxID=1043005 RepID=A0A074YJY8_AURSE|nr:uncharacterized protein AUEXF2481DRAFT_636468 [Aureobasidium subglaciale EXF-2481]KEQ96394.1 hypothetical protein AUEXF2481DRAFT_636468 [Aureobasidium subglaciale EXF-2481]